VKAIFRKSFERDLKRIKDRSVLEQAKQVIEETEAAANLLPVNFPVIPSSVTTTCGVDLI